MKRVVYCKEHKDTKNKLHDTKSETNQYIHKVFSGSRSNAGKEAEIALNSEKSNKMLRVLVKAN